MKYLLIGGLFVLLFSIFFSGFHTEPTETVELAPLNLEVYELNERGSHIPKEPLFVASRESDVYHELDCPHAERIKPDNRIYFNKREEAEEAGYRACEVCSK